MKNHRAIRAPRAGLYDSVIAACIASGFSPDIAHEAPQIVTTLNLVAAGWEFRGAFVDAAAALDAVVYRPMSARTCRRASSTLRFGRCAASPASAFLALVRKDAGAVRS